MVEVLRGQANRGRQAETARRLVGLPTLAGRRKGSGGSGRNLQRRLTAAEEQEAVESYEAGATIVELGKRFSVHRNTISKALARNGSARRYNLISPEQAADLGKSYRAGASLQQLGDEMGVDPCTVRRALLKAGVQTRPRPGT